MVNLTCSITNKKSLLNVYVIVSPSMEPTINKYDVVITKKENNYQKGDIITFYSNSIDTGGYTITHRINRISQIDNKNYYITKGDNNSKEDIGYIEEKDIVGKVIKVIPYIGYINHLIATKTGWIIIILIPTLLILIFNLYKIIRLININRDLNKIKIVKDTRLYQDKEDNKKLIALIEKANRINRR